MTDLPYQAEYAKTGRASCKGCKTQITKDSVRLAVMVQSAFFDGKQPNWFHEKCFFQKQRPQSIDEFSNMNSLRAPDQKRIKEAIGNVGSGVILPTADVGKPKKGKGTKRANDDTKALTAALKDFAIEYSKSSRATCRSCEIKICKGEVRVCKVVFDTEIGRKYGGQALWHHVKCFAEDRSNLMYWASGELLPGFKSLKAEDQEIVKKEIPEKPLDEVPVKKIKMEPKDEAEVKQDKELDKKMDVQNKLFFKYRDGLQKSGLRKAEFHEILEFNHQEVPSGIDKCLDLLADSMAFGALKSCTECKKGQLLLDTSGYVCTGNLTEWTKCQNITQKPDRIPFQVPADYKELSVFRRFKPKVIERIFLTAPKPSTSFIKTEPDLTKVKPEKPAPPLKNLKFFIFGRSLKNKDELKNRILKLGGSVPSKLDDSIIAVVSTQADVDKMPDKMKEIEELDIQVVTEEYIAEIEKENCAVKRSVELIVQHNIANWGKDPSLKLPKDVLDGKSVPKSGSIYVKSEKSGVTKLKVKGGSAVDPDSNLEDVAHVYKDRDGTKWTVVLGLTDIVAQRNSYYKLQLLEGDGQRRYWLFRSWGRIGTTIGGNKVESYGDLYLAKHSFEALYLDKTANKWGVGDSFKKVPGKMYPIDVDYHDGGEEEMKLESDKECKLPMPVQSLVQLIFDIQLMKQVLLEFELDTEKMPLGKLSKKQITSGYKVLKEVIKLIEDARKKNKNPDQNRVIDATNRFYTLIPHDFGVQNPPLLDNTEAITTKTQMLDSLLEIEIAYSMLKTESEDDKLSPIEAHYLKLKTEIMPMDKKSPEYELLSKYVHNTHAKTHSQYTLKINQIFKVVREGEEKRYKPFKKLHNRRLLWHGSRVTNFAGILSQGLRIAPPEAPVTGYMFGKGIYFADMVSKSANYCYTHKGSPTGVMLLCEVALGNMEECLSATSFSKAPPGKHSVWGMGRTEPDPAQNHVMDDGIIVPMGTPVDKSIGSSLLYNEFIIYDVAQVNVKYLFEMQFDYKY